MKRTLSLILLCSFTLNAMQNNTTQQIHTIFSPIRMGVILGIHIIDNSTGNPFPKGESHVGEYSTYGPYHVRFKFNPNTAPATSICEYTIMKDAELVAQDTAQLTHDQMYVKPLNEEAKLKILVYDKITCYAKNPFEDQ